MSKIVETSDGVFIEIDDSDTRTLQPLSEEDRIAELELRNGHLGNALEGAESDCATLSAEVDRLRALVGRLQPLAHAYLQERVINAGPTLDRTPFDLKVRQIATKEGLKPGDLDRLEDV